MLDVSPAQSTVTATPAPKETDAGPAVITDEIAAFLDRQRLGYVATVSPDGKPNVSPKGTITRWDRRTLIFADIRSPDTSRNIGGNHNVEISVIDPILRKGYLFVGTARIIRDQPVLEEATRRYTEMGIKSRIRSVFAVRISSVSTVTSPLYDIGMTEDEIRSRWTERLTGR